MQPQEISQLLAQLGGTCRSQPQSDWSGDYPLPISILDFYRSLGPDCVTIELQGNDLYLPSLSQLESYQIGYRSHPKSGERFSDWPDEWIVVGDYEADPFIHCDGEILFADHGTGQWQPYQLFSDIYQMAGAMATLGICIRDAGIEMDDEETEAVQRDLTLAIAKLEHQLGSIDAAEKFINALGLN